MFARDQWQCQRCGGYGALEAHHADTDPARFFDPAAILTFCRTCHIEHHRQGNPYERYRRRREGWADFAGELA